ncbi:MAG: PEP-CTERM sorting domain-containing protein [Pirellulales bacterium]|nr:PEP-CTERM sorting domain-containing protein [Pirellulales bacterium]
MSRMHLNSVVAAVALVFAGFATANADIIKVYDFSRCDVGDLHGQDSWATTGHSDVAPIKRVKVDDPAPAPMSDEYLRWDPTDVTYTASVYSQRVNNSDWGFSIPADEDFTFSTLTWVGSTYSQMMGRVALTDGVANAFWIGSRIGASGTPYNLHWYIPGIGYKYKMDAAGPSIWEVGIDATATDTHNVYDLELWYEKTPGDINTRVTAHTLMGVTLDMPTYNVIGVELRAYSATYNYVGVDDITISYVPEPSTIALLATGLIGLLAYAWRKRK